MKQIYLVLIGLFTLCVYPVYSAADDPTSGICGRKINFNVDSANLQWSFNQSTHTLTITGSGRMKDYDNDTKAPWYPWRNEIYTVSFPNGMTTVGNYAFLSCGELPQVTFPESVTEIGEYAFLYCYKLANVTFGNSLQRIRYSAFSQCTELLAVDFANSPVRIEGNAFYYDRKLKSLQGRKMKQIDGYAFCQCENLVHLDLGDSLQSIGSYAFASCYSLTNIHIPAKVRSIYSESFKACYSVDTITVDPENTTYDSRNNCNAIIHTASNQLVFGCAQTVIPSGIKSIGYYSFYECNRLTTIDLPVGLQSIDEEAFYNCSELTTINLPASITQLGRGVFKNCNKLTSIVLPEGLQTIGDEAFMGCTELTTINFPESITNVGCGVFKSCKKITTPIYNSTLFVYMPTSYAGSYTIPGSPKQVACQAFIDCANITSIIVPSSVTNLGTSAFYGCRSLVDVSLSERLKSINDQTFYDCQSLISIDIPDSVTSIGGSAFYYCKSLQSITLPANLTGFGGDMFGGCTSLREIIWNVRTYNEINVSYSWNDPLYSIRGQVTDFTFGNTVQVIPANLCYNMKELTSLSFGCDITKIGENAFEGCSNIKSIHWNVRTCADPQIYTQAPFYPLRDSITEFTFGDSVRHIPNYLCHSMSRLRQLHIPEYVSSIGAFSFRYISTLDSISVDENNSYYDSRNHCNALVETSSDVLLLGCYKTHIPGDIKGIGDCAFRNVRNLQSVELQENVTFVGKEAFNGCGDLKELRLSDAIERIDDYAFQSCDSLTSIDLPEHLTTVGFRAFARCTGLQAVNCTAATPPTIDETSFSNTSCPFYVPCAYITTYRSAPVWSDFGNRLSGEALYSLQVSPNEYAYGEVSVLQKPDCEHTAIIEATPSRGYRFVAWTDEAGNAFSTSARHEFVLEEDLSLIAVFERINQDIDAIQEDGTAIWYDIMGHRVAAPSHGVYIVVSGDEARKVVIP